MAAQLMYGAPPHIAHGVAPPHIAHGAAPPHITHGAEPPPPASELNVAAVFTGVAVVITALSWNTALGGCISRRMQKSPGKASIIYAIIITIVVFASLFAVNHLGSKLGRRPKTVQMHWNGATSLAQTGVRGFRGTPPRATGCNGRAPGCRS